MKFNSTFSMRSVWSDVLSEPVINNPGAYRSVCVELDVSTDARVIHDFLSISISLSLSYMS